MKPKRLLCLFCITLLITLGALSISIGSSPEVKTKMYYHDSASKPTNVTSVPPGETFSVQVNIANVTSLTAWQFYLRWNTSVLDFVDVIEGPFLSSSGAYTTDFGPVRKPGDEGWPYTDILYVADNLISATSLSAPSGSGTLARLIFRVKAIGFSAIHFVQEGVLVSKLMQYIDPTTPPPRIPHTTEDGYFVYPAPPKISVEPDEIIDTTLTVNRSFDINITVAGVESLYNWTARLKWDPSMLNAANIVEGPFLKGAQGTTFNYVLDQLRGSIYLNNTRKGDPPTGISGNGTLATVTFAVKARGFSTLEIFDAKLFKSDRTLIVALWQDGYFSNMRRDIAIRSVSASPTSVTQGESVRITVEVENKGKMNETFTVTVTYDSSVVGTSSVSELPPNEVRTLPALTWDTTEVAAGSYNITAVASQLFGEIDFSNNVGYATTGVTVVVKQSGIPTTLMIGAVAAIAVAGIAVFFLFYRRSKS